MIFMMSKDNRKIPKQEKERPAFPPSGQHRTVTPPHHTLAGGSLPRTRDKVFPERRMKYSPSAGDIVHKKGLQDAAQRQMLTGLSP